MTQGRVLDCHLQHPGLGCISFALLNDSLYFHSNALYPNIDFQEKRTQIPSFDNNQKASLNCLKSLLFLSSMVGIIRLTICTLKDFRDHQEGIDGLIIGSFSGTSIILESDGRGFEMTLQLFPRFCEAVYNHFHKKFPKLKMKTLN